METHFPSGLPLPSGNPVFFKPGTTIIYPPHGKYLVSSIEQKTIQGKEVEFYRLEKQKSMKIPRNSQSETAIWVPVKLAIERGLRLPMNQLQANAAIEVISSREYYFPINEPWNRLQPLLEKTLRLEGGIGLAKVFSFFFIFKKKMISLPTPILKFEEITYRLLIRELAEVFNESQKTIEERLNKLAKSKLELNN